MTSRQNDTCYGRGCLAENDQAQIPWDLKVQTDKIVMAIPTGHCGDQQTTCVKILL